MRHSTTSEVSNRWPIIYRFWVWVCVGRRLGPEPELLQINDCELLLFDGAFLFFFILYGNGKSGKGNSQSNCMWSAFPRLKWVWWTLVNWLDERNERVAGERGDESTGGGKSFPKACSKERKVDSENSLQSRMERFFDVHASHGRLWTSVHRMFQYHGDY